MRAFGILCVVVAHIYSFSLPVISDSFVLSVIKMFFMPLFFYISGKLAKERVDSFSKLIDRIKLLILPTISMGILFCLYQNVSIKLLFITESHWGFWFLPTLFAIYLLWNLRNYLLCRICFLKANPFVFDVFFLLLFIASFRLMPHYTNNVICDVLCVRHISQYLIYFWGGYYMNKYLGDNNEKHQKIYSYSLPFALLLVVLLYYSLLNIIIIRILCSFLIIIVIEYLFKIFSARLNALVSKIASIIGTKTLEIYLLHFFLIPRGNVKLESLLNSLFINNICIELMVIIGMALIVLFFSILIVEIVSYSSILNYILFGKNAKKG